MTTHQQPPPAVTLPEKIATGLHKISLAMKQHAWQQSHEAGLSPTQAQILAAIATHGDLTASELAARLGVTLPTISDAVRALSDKALVVKRPDPRHPRASLIAPTERGAAHGASARSWPEFVAASVGDLTDDEQHAFYAGVVKMITGLQQRGHVPVHGMCSTCTWFRPNVRAGQTPHHCAFVDAPLGVGDLRLDCSDHVPTEAAVDA